jgi:hypothetical protein
MLGKGETTPFQRYRMMSFYKSRKNELQVDEEKKLNFHENINDP